MGRYTVQWDYESSLGGFWRKGDVIQLDDEVAEAVNRDSPGVLKRVKGRKRGENRQVVEGRTRARDNTAGDQGVMTKGSFGAVREE